MAANLLAGIGNALQMQMSGNPFHIDGRLLPDGSYAVKVEANEDEQETQITFGTRDYERKFFSDETNLSFIRCFLNNAKCDLIADETGKTIMFAVSRKLVTLPNEEVTRRWPKEYAAGSTFATQVTSDIAGALQMTIAFANDNLNGKSKWRAEDFRDYDTSPTRVCLTLGMMTTGYDCEDVLTRIFRRRSRKVVQGFSPSGRRDGLKPRTTLNGAPTI